MTISVAHNRAAGLKASHARFSSTREQFDQRIVYQVSESDFRIVQRQRHAFSIVARPFETHTWMFGLGSGDALRQLQDDQRLHRVERRQRHRLDRPVMKQGA